VPKGTNYKKEVIKMVESKKPTAGGAIRQITALWFKDVWKFAFKVTLQCGGEEVEVKVTARTLLDPDKFQAAVLEQKGRFFEPDRSEWKSQVRDKLPSLEDFSEEQWFKETEDLGEPHEDKDDAPARERLVT
jgi:hypothetical protein